MKLKEVLEFISDSIVYIGSNNGNGFNYIGSPKNYSEIVRRYEGCKVNIDILIFNKQKEIKKTLDYEKWRERMIKSMNSRGEKIDENKISSEAHKKKMDSLYNALSKYCYKKDSYVPILEREVVDIYKRNLTDKHTAIIIDGYESNGYWFKHEYDHGYTEEEEEEVC